METRIVSRHRLPKFLQLLAMIMLALYSVCVVRATAQAQQDSADAPSAKSAQAEGNDRAVEGTVISMTHHTIVVLSGDNQYHLFTYAAGTVHHGTVKPGVHVRVNGSAPDEAGTRVADSIVVIPEPGSGAANSGPEPPPQMSKVTAEIESEARRWHVGGKIGTALSPELFMLGPQAQFGPYFSSHLLFRPNVEFGFGEVTDMYAVNGEAIYRFNSTLHGKWSPYLGMGPSFNFIHQSASNGKTSFSDFKYKTGFNLFVGGQKKKTFVEMKTSLWSAQAPVFRLFVGYNF